MLYWKNPFALVSLAKNDTSENPVPRFAGIRGEPKSAVRIALALLGAEIQTFKVLKVEQQSFPHLVFLIFLLPSPHLAYFPPPHLA
jgi:hypothetical protein